VQQLGLTIRLSKRLPERPSMYAMPETEKFWRA